MVQLRRGEGGECWEIVNHDGSVIRSHLDEAAALAEYERLAGTVDRRVLAHVPPRTEWLDGFRAGYLAGMHNGEDGWVGERVEGLVSSRAESRRALPPAPYGFAYWALGLLNGEWEYVSDGAGFNGRLVFHDEGRSGKPKRILVAGKPAAIGVADVRQLCAALEREQAQIGVLISPEQAAKSVQAEARKAGAYTSPLSGEQYARIQLLTVAELYEGKGVDYPGVRENLTGSSRTSAEAVQANVVSL